MVQAVPRLPEPLQQSSAAPCYLPRDIPPARDLQRLGQHIPEGTLGGIPAGERHRQIRRPGIRGGVSARIEEPRQAGGELQCFQIGGVVPREEMLPEYLALGRAGRLSHGSALAENPNLIAQVVGEHAVVVLL